MSYHRPTRRSLGQVPQAVAVTCADGSIIGMPPGGDADAMCREHHLKAQPPTDVLTMPQPTAADVAVQTMSPAVTTTNSTVPMQPTVQLQPLPADIMTPMPTWIIPAIYVGAFGFLVWAAKSA